MALFQHGLVCRQCKKRNTKTKIDVVIYTMNERSESGDWLTIGACRLGVRAGRWYVVPPCPWHPHYHTELPLERQKENDAGNVIIYHTLLISIIPSLFLYLMMMSYRCGNRSITSPEWSYCLISLAIFFVNMCIQWVHEQVRLKEVVRLTILCWCHI